MTDKNKQESTEELYDRVGKEISSLREPWVFSRSRKPQPTQYSHS